MSITLAASVSLAFVALAIWHFGMALHPSTGASGAVPSLKGVPLFVPSAKATAAIGIGLLSFAYLVAATGELVDVAIPPPVLAGASFLLSFGLLARAIGDFKYVGLFKRVRGSRFAKLDTLVYSPSCALLSAGVAVVAWHRAV